MPNPNDSDLRKEYFATLRDEIKATKARIFVIMIITLLGAPVLTYISAVMGSLTLMVAPFVILVLLALYLSEQTLLMRAGRYIKENVEGSDRDWEHWVGTLGLRAAERQLFAMFIIVCLVFYIILLTPAVEHIMSLPRKEPWFSYYFAKVGVPFIYAIGTLWVMATLIRFWRHAVSTSD